MTSGYSIKVIRQDQYTQWLRLKPNEKKGGFNGLKFDKILFLKKIMSFILTCVILRLAFNFSCTKKIHYV